MDEEAGGRRPTRLVVVGVGMFLVAVFLARLLVAGGGAWIVFALCLPVLLFVLSAAASFRFALAATGVFVVVVFALLWFLKRSPTGWIALLLLPVLAFTAMLVGRVLGQMKRDRLARQRRSGHDETGPGQ